MKSNLSFKSIQFSVDKENRRVYCSLRAFIPLYYRSSKKGKVFTAVAKCAEEDEFNEIIGKRIAESRAKIKAYKWAIQNHTEAVEDYKDYLNSYCIYRKSQLKCKSLLKREIDHLSKLINNENSN